MFGNFREVVWERRMMSAFLAFPFVIGQLFVFVRLVPRSHICDRSYIQFGARHKEMDLS